MTNMKIEDLIKLKEKQKPKGSLIAPDTARMNIIINTDEARFGFNEMTVEEMYTNLCNKYSKVRVDKVLSDASKIVKKYNFDTELSNTFLTLATEKRKQNTKDNTR